MNVRAARRFSNVRRLFVLCLLKPTEDEDNVTLSTDSAMCLVSFATTFPKLEYLFAGCKMYDDVFGKEALTSYANEECVAPDNHNELMQGLITSFCGAFMTGSLPDCFRIVEGISDSVGICRPCLDSDHIPESITHCTFCMSACSCLPLDDVLNTCGRFSFCFSWAQFYETFFQRPGGVAYAKEKSIRILEDFIGALFCNSVELRAKERESLQRRFGQHQLVQRYARYISDDNFSSAKDAWPYLCKILQFSKKNVVRCVSDHVRKYSESSCWPKSFVDRLVEIGIPVDRDKFETILDDSTDPVLSLVREAIASDH